eukprot:TRINITY_DN12896_c0_g1_i2.p1 TRINITY_DN12896_c0_g1~~TRINITY_DN12896_c0_g1_i2.p1  ORF type:complete len:180 (-),score=25.62 TRINITY_DN12896_c0_g1_i2:86-568(-)
MCIRDRFIRSPIGGWQQTSDLVVPNTKSIGFEWFKPLRRITLFQGISFRICTDSSYLVAKEDNHLILETFDWAGDIIWRSKVNQLRDYFTKRGFLLRKHQGNYILEREQIVNDTTPLEVPFLDHPIWWLFDQTPSSNPEEDVGCYTKDVIIIGNLSAGSK